WTECRLSEPFVRIVAERVYKERFPKATLLSNYPRLSLVTSEPRVDPNSRALLYTGNVTRDRGAVNLAKLVRELPDVRMTIAGKCSPAVAQEIRLVAGNGANRIRLIGEGRHVPFEEIAALYREETWLAGIVLMSDSPHYREKELTKFFEFMAAGIPVIATDVPAWRGLIVDQGVGLCVDPGDVRSVWDAISFLVEHPQQAREMGQRGQQLVRERYAWEHQAAKLITLYHGIMQK
ncbi:MAG: glycosyltransferase family 4 protein, partial [Spirochaetota bacterium]